MTLRPLLHFLSANLLPHPEDFITRLFLATKTILMILSEVVPYPGDHKHAKLGLAEGGYLHMNSAQWEVIIKM